MSLSLHTRLAAVTHLADGEFLQVAVNREQFTATCKNSPSARCVIIIIIIIIIIIL
jgi:hypothetical protein